LLSTALLLALPACDKLIGAEFDRYTLAASKAADAGKPASDAGTDATPPDASPDAPAICTGTCGTPGCGTCPFMPQADLGAFLVDTTEVTQAHYAAFLAAAVAPATQPQDTCAWNASFEPQAACAAGVFDPASKPELPVSCVDWCDARAYCAWARKRPCRVDGATPFADFDKANLSQWHSACTGNAKTVYPYGSTYDPGACNGGEYQDGSVGAALAVKSASGCRGKDAPYNGVYDLGGNVAEWEDSCQQATGENDVCRARGGSYFSDSAQLRCDGNFSTNRGAASPTIGIRCCQDK
jgi:formylglycine-generating enzyme required for sulfatase activity